MVHELIVVPYFSASLFKHLLPLACREWRHIDVKVARDHFANVVQVETPNNLLDNSDDTRSVETLNERE